MSCISKRPSVASAPDLPAMTAPALAAQLSEPTAGAPSLRRLIPPEHGAWGFLAAAVLPGLVVAPSAPGFLLTAGVVLGLFARHATQLALAGVPVVGPALVLGGTAGAAWLGAGILAPTALPWMVGAAALTALQLASEAGVRRHRTSGVLVGGCALALVGGAVASAGGTPLAHALVIAGVVVGYLLAVVPLVRARRQPTSHWTKDALAGHAAAAVAAVAAAALGHSPWLVAGFFVLLAARCAWLVRDPTPATPKAIGLAELPPLLALVLATAAGLGGGL